MSLSFWACVTVMCVLALAMVARPLIRSKCIRAAGVIAVALPAGAAAFYSQLGSPGASDHPYSGHAAAEPARKKHGKVGSVASMVDSLAARLEADPEDASGWLLLFHSYQHLGRHEEAEKAYERARALGAFDTEYEDSSHSKAAVHEIGVVGSVRLSARAMTLVEPHDQVFIFARAPNLPGPPAAVLRSSVSEMPLDFRLDDSNAMVDGVRLSDFESVVVTARISRSGSATETLENLQVKSSTITVGNQERVDLVID